MNSSKRDTLTTVIAIALMVYGIAVLGCVKNTKPVPLPKGFINTYDQQIYATLYSAEAAIRTAKVSFGTNPKAKKPLNTAIAAYNDSLTGYLVWRGAAASNPAADHTGLDNTIAILLGAIAAIEQQLQTALTPQ